MRTEEEVERDRLWDEIQRPSNDDLLIQIKRSLKAVYLDPTNASEMIKRFDEVDECATELHRRAMESEGGE